MIAQDTLIRAAPSAIAAVLGLAAAGGIAWLVGVHRHEAMFDAGHARAAFAAVKQAAGPRMQVRKIEIARDEMTVLAMDPDMPEWRYVAGRGRAGPAGHWYDAPGIFEQSWRVAYWTVFGRDWYRVSGPVPEGIIQRDEGRPFDLRPQDIPDLPDLVRQTIPDPMLASSPCARTVTIGAQWWTVCLDTQGAPILVFLQSH